VPMVTTKKNGVGCAANLLHGQKYLFCGTFEVNRRNNGYVRYRGCSKAWKTRLHKIQDAPFRDKRLAIFLAAQGSYAQRPRLQRILIAPLLTYCP
jgi:hypothetical protein